jgi:hypothetical protein
MNRREVLEVYLGQGDLEARMRVVRAAFEESHGFAPTVMVVARDELAAAQEIAVRRGWGVEIEGNGGCLVGEVWAGGTDGA